MSGGSANTSPRLAGLPPGFRILWFTVALDLVGFGIVVPILGRYAERFGASGFEVGLLFASFSLAQLVFTPILGDFVAMLGSQRTEADAHRMKRPAYADEVAAVIAFLCAEESRWINGVNLSVDGGLASTYL